MSTDLREVFAQRLAYYIRRGEGAAFAREAGIDKGRLSRLVNARTLNVELKTVVRFAKALGVEPRDLLTEPDTARPADFQLPTPLGPRDYTAVPLLIDEIAAGLPRLNEDRIEEYYALRSDWVAANKHGRALVLARVARGWHGSSMANTILPRSLLTVDLGVEKIVDGRIYIVRLPEEDGGVTCKRVWYRDRHLICTSDNLAFAPFTIDMKRGDEISKYVVGRVRRWTNQEE
jgi:phage repressor protein C with HTH and peptisase S24 domain